MPDTTVTTTIEDDVAVVRIDDGKANAISHQVIDELHGALDRSNDDATAICFVGREGKFSGGFDLSVMTESPESARKLVQAGGELLMRIYGFGQPTVAAVTGHALAAGALLALACDTRVGADIPAKVGLNETAIGITLPRYGIELARERLSKRHFTRGALQAEIYSPSDAVDAGYLDLVVDPSEVESTAVAEARRLGELSHQAYSTTKRRSRGELIKSVLDDIEADMDEILPPSV